MSDALNIEGAVRTRRKDQAWLGYSEYYFKNDAARNAVIPKKGDRAVMKNGDIYFCWDENIGWERIGG